MKSRTGARDNPVPLDDEPRGPSLFFPAFVVAEVERLLRTYGDDDDHEGIVYLGGAEMVDAQGSIALVALSPRAETTWGSFRTGLSANTSVVEALASLSLTLVGQVHSHPGDWVDHSDGDDEGALVKFQGYWSLVVPSFAHRGMLPIEACGVHVYRERAFRRLTEAAIHRRVHVVPAFVDLRERAS